MLIAALLAALACPLTVTVTRDSQTIGGHPFDMANLYVANPTSAAYVIDAFHVGGQDRSPAQEDGASVSDLTVAPNSKHYFAFDINAAAWDPGAASSVECHVSREGQ